MAGLTLLCAQHAALQTLDRILQRPVPIMLSHRSARGLDVRMKPVLIEDIRAGCSRPEGLKQ